MARKQMRDSYNKDTVKFDRTGLTKEEIDARTDQNRAHMLDYITATNGTVTIQMCAKKIGVTYDAARNYGNYLVKLGCVTKSKIGSETYYKPTGRPYIIVRKNSKREAADDGILNIPQARVIRLMDRKPSEVSKQEHQAGRRATTRSGWSGSSMNMFDSW